MRQSEPPSLNQQSRRQIGLACPSAEDGWSPPRRKAAVAPRGADSWRKGPSEGVSFEAAVAAFAEGLLVAPCSALLRGGLAAAHGLAGRPADARALLAELEGWSARANRAYAIARVYAVLGEFDQAFAWLRQSADDRDSHVIWVGLDFIFAELRQDPRYAAFVREVGLPH